MIRQPAVAGQFYPGSKQALTEEVDRYMKTDKEPVAAIGVVSPHAGYVYSGKVAGEVLSAAKQMPLHDTFGAAELEAREPAGIAQQLAGRHGLLQITQIQRHLQLEDTRPARAAIRLCHRGRNPLRRRNVGPRGEGE